MPLSATARRLSDGFHCSGGGGKNMEGGRGIAGDEAGDAHVGIAKGFGIAKYADATEFRPTGSENGDEMRKPFADLGLLGANHHGYSGKTMQTPASAQLSYPPLDWESAAQVQKASTPGAQTSGMMRHQQIPRLENLEPRQHQIQQHRYVCGMTAQQQQQQEQQQMEYERVVDNFNRALMMYIPPRSMPQAGGSMGPSLSFHHQTGHQWCQHQQHSNSQVSYNHQMMYPLQVLAMERSDSMTRHTLVDSELEAQTASYAAGYAVWKESRAQSALLSLQADLQRENRLTSERHRELHQLKQAAQKFRAQEDSEKDGILSRLVIGAAQSTRNLKGSVAGGTRGIIGDGCENSGMLMEDHTEAAAEEGEERMTREGKDSLTGTQTEKVASCAREAKEEEEEDERDEEGEGKNSDRHACDEMIQNLSRLLLG